MVATMEPTKEKAASPGRGEAAQSTTDSSQHSTLLTAIRKVDPYSLLMVMFIAIYAVMIVGGVQ